MSDFIDDFEDFSGDELFKQDKKHTKLDLVTPTQNKDGGQDLQFY